MGRATHGRLPRRRVSHVAGVMISMVLPLTGPPKMPAPATPKLPRRAMPATVDGFGRRGPFRLLLPHRFLPGAVEPASRLVLTRRVASGCMNSSDIIRKIARMLPIPRRHAHFVFGVIQSGLTSLIAAAIASASFFGDGTFVRHWLTSWIIAWGTMLPIVLFAAPFIRMFAVALTREDPDLSSQLPLDG